jgi:hypothetical protein
MDSYKKARTDTAKKTASYDRTRSASCKLAAAAYAVYNHRCICADTAAMQPFP